MVKFRFFDPDDEKKPTQPAQAPAEHPAMSFTQAASAPAAVPIVAKSSHSPKVSPTGFTLTWIHQLHWRANPFTELAIKPAHAFVVNQDVARQHINLFFIKEKSFGVIRGEPGHGKTFMLHWLAEELKPYGDRFAVHGFEGSVPVGTFISKLTQPHDGIFAKYKGTGPEDLSEFLAKKAKRRLVLLVDNADVLADQLGVYLKQLLHHNNAVVIFAGVNPPHLSHDELNISLSPLHPQDVTKLVEKRIAAVGGSGAAPFTPRLLEELFKASNHNLKTFLAYCNETAMKIALKQYEVPEEPVQEDAPAKKTKEPAKPKASVTSYDDLIAGLVK